jgi:hypothetical protein
MPLDWLRRFFAAEPPDTPRGQQELPAVQWLRAEDNPWGVPILDVTPITCLLSTTTNPEMAANSASFSNEDGLKFAAQPPASRRTIDANLRYRIDGEIYDGVLFNPEAMEHKWALYFHGGRIICVRAWTRQVHLVADTRRESDWIVIHRIYGSVYADDELPSFTIRALDFLIASHAMRLMWLAPIPSAAPADDRRAAVWVMSCFGSLAEAATRDEPVAEPGKRSLRTDSLLHIAAARGQLNEIRALTARGVPVDLRSRTGRTPLQWANAAGRADAAALLLEFGADPNAPDPTMSR